MHDPDSARVRGIQPRPRVQGRGRPPCTRSPRDRGLYLSQFYHVSNTSCTVSLPKYSIYRLEIKYTALNILFRFRLFPRLLLFLPDPGITNARIRTVTPNLLLSPHAP